MQGSCCILCEAWHTVVQAWSLGLFLYAAGPNIGTPLLRKANSTSISPPLFRNLCLLSTSPPYSPKLEALSSLFFSRFTTQKVNIKMYTRFSNSMYCRSTLSPSSEPSLQNKRHWEHYFNHVFTIQFLSDCIGKAWISNMAVLILSFSSFMQILCCIAHTFRLC